MVVHPEDIQCIGRNKDTLKIEKNGIVYIKFFAKDIIFDLMQIKNDMKVTIIGTANMNEWMGNVTPQIFIKDIDIKEITNLSF
jgi:single-stranded-DNA-specific exonuclease